VDAIDGKGCEATDRINVNVARPREIAVPTGFSPNGDGVNDILRVHGRKGARVKVFRVFDRWGELLYETGDFEVNDPLRGWDGTFRGELLNSGVYVWYLVAGYPDGSEESFQGQTTLIR
jgi:gliding motility-associated-like protein